jgi:hypothetical protein
LISHLISHLEVNMTTSSSRWPKGEAGFLLAVSLLSLIGIGAYFLSADPLATERAMLAEEARPVPLPAGPRQTQ